MSTKSVSLQSQTLLGLVDNFSSNSASGWISGTSDDFPVRIELYLNETLLSATWANNSSSLATNDEIKGFFIGMREVWSYAKTGDHISLRANGTALPIRGHGAFHVVEGDGAYSLQDLSQRFEEGYLFDRSGRLHLSKKLDIDWQANVISLYNSVRKIIKTAFGYDLFLFYGSLLGQVREGGFIGHDNDFDTAYVSNYTNGPEAAAELCDIGCKLIDAGFYIDRKFNALHIHDPHDHTNRIDVFHTYFNIDGELALPFGRAGNDELTRDEWKGVTTGRIAHHDVLVPVDAERVVAHLYGNSWRTPQVGFSWKHARTQRDLTGRLSDEDRQILYWANFYAHNAFTSGSSFFEKVSSYGHLPSNIIDIGAGDGRDSFAFSRIGRHVLGVDRSIVGINQASKKAASEGLSGLLSFKSCDVSDAHQLRSTLNFARQQANGQPLLFYMRFFLHSIPEKVQQELMSEIARIAQKGDFIAAEFRTDKDKRRHKTFTKHYRRYQNGPAFGRELRQRYGFTVVEEEQGTGLSVYKDEDPHLYRVIARKGTTPWIVYDRAARLAGKYSLRAVALLRSTVRRKLLNRIARTS